MKLTGKNFLIGEWILVGACFIFVIARLLVRSWHRVWSFWLSEIFLVVALLFFVSLVIGDTYTYSIGMDAFDDTYYDVGFAKWKFASSVIFDLSFYFPRFSALAFYYELFPPSDTKLRGYLHATTAYTVGAFVTAASVDIFWCGTDVEENWMYDAKKCALANTIEPMYICWSIGIASELLIFALPFQILKTKALKQRERRALVCIFGFGVVTILVSVTRFILTVQSIWDYSTYLVGSAEIATQIIVIALPALRPLLNVISRKWSKLSDYGTQSNATVPTHDIERDAALSSTSEIIHIERQVTTFLDDSDGAAPSISPSYTSKFKEGEM